MLFIKTKQAIIMQWMMEEMGTHSHQHPSKQTTQLHTAFLLAKSSQKQQKQWICSSTSCMTANSRNNSDFIGDQEK